MYRTVFWTLWEKARVGCFKRTVSKHVYYLGWHRSPAQAGCMRQVLRHGALGRPRGIRWRGRWEGQSGWGTHVNPWLIHVSIWQKPLQYCKVISLQLIKINEKNKNNCSFLYLLYSNYWIIPLINVDEKNQSWIFIERTDVEAEIPILWPPDAKSWLIWKDPDAGKGWGQEEKGTTEDEMVGWHHWLNGHGFG